MFSIQFSVSRPALSDSPYSVRRSRRFVSYEECVGIRPLGSVGGLCNEPHLYRARVLVEPAPEIFYAILSGAGIGRVGPLRSLKRGPVLSIIRFGVIYSKVRCSRFISVSGPICGRPWFSASGPGPLGAGNRNSLG